MRPSRVPFTGFNPRFFPALLVAAAGLPLQTGALQACPQNDSTVTREGGDWVQTSTGTVALCAACRLRVNTEGNMVVRGASGPAGSVRFSLKKRVRASSALEAARILREFEIRSRALPNQITLTLLVPRRNAQGAELSLTVPRSLRHTFIESLGGDLTASDLDGEVQAQTAAGRVQLDRIGSNAVIKTGGGEIRVGRVTGAIRCVSGGGGIQAESCGRDSWFETAGGDIRIREALGTVHAATNGGNIRVERSAGEVFARTAAGVIEVLQATGLVTAETSSGAIQVGSSKGVRCESSAGPIRLRNVSGGSMRASTGIGSIVAELMSGAHIEDSMLSTNAGDITVLLSSNIPITVQARNETAGGGRRIVSDFPEIRVRNATSMGAIPLLAEGALNGGGPVLQIFASGGTIYLRRQK